jgi:hypothetical protein
MVGELGASKRRSKNAGDYARGEAVGWCVRGLDWLMKVFLWAGQKWFSFLIVRSACRGGDERAARGWDPEIQCIVRNILQGRRGEFTRVEGVQQYSGSTAIGTVGVQ